MALEKVLTLAEKWEGKAVLYDVQGQPLSAKEAYINAAAIRALVEEVQAFREDREAKCARDRYFDDPTFTRDGLKLLEERVHQTWNRVCTARNKTNALNDGLEV